MLDFRAWIIAGLVLLSAAGAYVIWITRPRAGYAARSLSAARPPSNLASQPVTKSLHVEGCKDDFLVNPGELVEPRVVPGSTLDQFRNIYGKESDKEGPSIFVWSGEAYDLRMIRANAEEPEDSVQISLNGRHVLETIDGIELGLDSFGTIFRKMRDRKVEAQEHIRRSGDHWILTVSIHSSCGGKFRSEYFRSIPASPETDSLINRRSIGTDGRPGQLRSDVFMNKVVYDYIMETSDGKDGSNTGEFSEHD
jgi:hypothetical protein